MGSEFYDWVYWHFFMITVSDYSSHLTAEASLHSASCSMILSLITASPLTLTHFPVGLTLSQLLAVSRLLTTPRNCAEM
jgi:hypothetical protein